MSQPSARVRLYVTRGQRKDFYATMAPARDRGDDSFVFMDTTFYFDKYNTVYTEFDLGEMPPALISEGHCRTLNVIISSDAHPARGEEQAGYYDGRLLGYSNVSAYVMSFDVAGISVQGKTLAATKQLFNLIMAGSLLPTTRASQMIEISPDT